MNQEDRLFDPQAKRCWSCTHCVYDMANGYQCQKLRKPLGGKYEINLPNECNDYQRD